MNNQEDTQIQEARKKLAEKFGDSTRLGGKGTQRRKQKKVVESTITDDKKLKQVIRKFGVQPIPGIDEVNMFKDDNSVLHFKRPEVLASIQSNTFVIIGKPETKNIQDLFPEILTHLGPKQMGLLKDLLSKQMKNVNKKSDNPIPEQNEDDIPDLVENFEEVSKKLE